MNAGHTIRAMSEPTPSLPEEASSGVRYRCGACGNLTRFDVFESKRSRRFHHYSLGGELNIEEEDVLAHEIERIVCRWCGSADSIETIRSSEGGA
jgi:ribosomal protein S27AE